jgi:pyruvate-formate lyase
MACGWDRERFLKYLLEMAESYRKETDTPAALRAGAAAQGYIRAISIVRSTKDLPSMLGRAKKALAEFEAAKQTASDEELTRLSGLSLGIIDLIGSLTGRTD